MGNKILLSGVIIFLIGGAGWFVFVIFSVITLGELRGVANFFGAAAGLGILMIVIGTILKLVKKTNRLK